MDVGEFKRSFLVLHTKLYRVAYRILENQEDAEDVVQETYAKLWKQRKNFVILTNYEAFATTVLKNTCLDFLKKNKIHFVPIEGLAIEANHSASFRIEEENIQIFIQTVVERLPLQQQRIFQLYYRDHFSLTEIEEITGLKYDNIKMILSRVRKQIKEYGQKLELI